MDKIGERIMNINQQRVISLINKQKIITILRGIPTEYIIPVVGAIVDGGISLVEVTFDHTSSEALERTAESIRIIKEHFGDAIEVGAGTVIDCNDVTSAMNAGATFMISPNTDEAVIKYTKKMGLVSIPGALTPTEICGAYKWGADFVKLFPLGSDAQSYIRAIRAPLCHIPMLAVGGVTVENCGDIMKTGVCGIGIGSGIIKASELGDISPDGDFSFITERAKKYVENVGNK